QQFDRDFRVVFAEEAKLAVLAVGQGGSKGSNFDEEVVVGQVKIRGKHLVGTASLVPSYGKGPRLIFPVDAVEIQETGYLRLTFVGKFHQRARGGAVAHARSLRSQASFRAFRRLHRCT